MYFECEFANSIQTITIQTRKSLVFEKILRVESAETMRHSNNLARRRHFSVFAPCEEN